ncbi:MAG: SRPBCC family protein [Anaerolineales bacterium]|nr:SRPBCC family protein [Anaerolineales bacterium]
MSGFTLTEWIARTPTEVFDFVTAPENAPKVVSSVTSMTRLTQGPLRVGTKYRETRMMNGKEQSTELEVVAFDPHHAYGMKNVTSGIESVYRYHFQAENNGTRVNLVCEVIAKGFKKLLTPLVASILKKEDGDHLQRLKKALET